MFVDMLLMILMFTHGLNINQILRHFQTVLLCHHQEIPQLQWEHQWMLPQKNNPMKIMKMEKVKVENLL